MKIQMRIIRFPGSFVETEILKVLSLSRWGGDLLHGTVGLRRKDKMFEYTLMRCGSAP